MEELVAGWRELGLVGGSIVSRRGVDDDYYCPWSPSDHAHPVLGKLVETGRGRLFEQLGPEQDVRRGASDRSSGDRSRSRGERLTIRPRINPSR